MRYLFLLLTLLLFLPTQAQDFELEYLVDPMTDEREPVLFIYPTNEGSKSMLLGVRCFTPGASLVLGHKHLGGDRNDRVRFQYRFDNGTPSPFLYWNLMGNRETSVSQDAHDHHLIRRMKNSERLRIELTDPLDGEVLFGDYNLRGFDPYLRQFSQACPSYP